MSSSSPSFITRHAKEREATLHSDKQQKQLLWLIRLLQLFNACSLGMAVYLMRSTTGSSTSSTSSLSNYEYVTSMRLFVPSWILDWVFSSPQTVLAPHVSISFLHNNDNDDNDNDSTRLLQGNLYFPGVALECVWGILQGVGLAAHYYQWIQPQTHTLSSYESIVAYFPAVTCVLYANMCASAFPLHCFLPWQSTTGGRSLALWIDTVSTATASLVAGGHILWQLGHVTAQQVQTIVLGMVVPLGAALTAHGVLTSNPWIMLALHGGVLAVAASISLVLMGWHHYKTFRVVVSSPPRDDSPKRENKLSTPSPRDAWSYIVQGAVVFAIMVLPLLMTLGNAAQAWERWNYCILTIFFWVSRMLLVQYWAYCCCSTCSPQE